MHIAILCPGPSLARFDSSLKFDCTIGVNRAATMYLCDVWAAGDYPLVQSVRDSVLGTPKLLTASNSSAHIRDHFTVWPHEVVTFESMYNGSEERFQWTMFTATAALWYASRIGAKSISVFGADWSGTKDCDGIEAGLNRSNERWHLEQFLWNRIVEHVGNQGALVRRVSL